MNPYEMTLDQISTGRERARQAGDLEAVERFNQVERQHPTTLTKGYFGARGVGDFEVQERARQLYAKEHGVTDDSLAKNDMWMKDVYDVYQAETGQKWNGDAAGLHQWGKEYAAGLAYNSVDFAGTAGKALMNKFDTQQAQALLGVMDWYDRKEASLEGTGRAIKEVLLDPITYVGVGVGKAAAAGGAQVAKKGLYQGLKKSFLERFQSEAAKEAAGAATKDIAQAGLSKTGRGIVKDVAKTEAKLGAAVGAGREIADETIELTGDARDSYSGTDVALGAAGGAAIGAALGGAAALPSAVMRRAARGKFQKAAKETAKASEAPVADFRVQQAFIKEFGTPDQVRKAQLYTKHANANRGGALPFDGMAKVAEDVARVNPRAAGSGQVAAEVANTAFVEAANGAATGLRALQKLTRNNRLPLELYDQVKTSIMTAKSPKGLPRAADMGEVLEKDLDKEARTIIEGLSKDTMVLDELARGRNLKDQKSQLLAALETPQARALADVFLPGGSTASSMVVRAADPVLRRLAPSGTPIASRLTARATANKLLKDIKAPNLDNVLKGRGAEAADAYKKSIEGKATAYKELSGAKDTRQTAQAKARLKRNKGKVQAAAEGKVKNVSQAQRAAMDAENQALAEALGEGVDAGGGVRAQLSSETGMAQREVDRGLALIREQLAQGGKSLKAIDSAIANVRSNERLPEKLYYRFQDKLNAMADAGELSRNSPNWHAAQTEADSVVRNPIAYKAAVKRAHQYHTSAVKAIDSLPVPANVKEKAKGTANKVAQAKTKAAKVEILDKAVEDLKAYPEVVAILESTVRFMTEIGK